MTIPLLALPNPVATAWQVQAALFDPNDNGVDIGDISLTVGVLVVIVTVVAWLMKRFRDEILTDLTERTKQIQEKANGGYSLPDVHVRLDRQGAAIGLLLDTVQAQGHQLREQGQLLRNIAKQIEQQQTSTD